MQPLHPCRCAAAALLSLLALTACGDDDTPSSPAPDGGSASADGGDGAGLETTDDECVAVYGADDHVFECGGLTFLTKVDARCLQEPCGLIVDVHGLTMSGQQMRDNTRLHELAPEAGYITVHPSAPGAPAPGEDPTPPGGAWGEENYPTVLDFMQRVIDVYEVDPKRVHFTGFSQGGAMTWWFVCNHSDLIASAAPNAAAFGMAEGPCVDASWSPRIPILYMNGETDTASTIEDSRAMRDQITSELSLSQQGAEEGDGTYTRVRYTGDDGMLFDYVEHKGGGQLVLAGHCIPGGVDTPGADNNYSLNATTCTEGDVGIHWGEAVLEFFQAHPKP